MPNDFFQQVTIWSATPNGYGGYTYAAPITVDGRWEQRSELFMDPSGREVVSRAIAYLGVDVEEEDYLAEGEFTDADPTTVSGAHKVRAFFKIPDLRNLDYERKAMM